MRTKTSSPRSLVSLLPLAAAAAFAPGVAQASGPPPDAFMALVNGKQGLCLDPAGDQAESRAAVALGPCDGKPDQRWSMRPVPGASGQFELVNEKSGNCLDVKGYSALERDDVMMYACDKNPDQYWRKQPRANGGFALQNVKGIHMVLAMNTGLCLDFKGTGGGVGAGAELYRCPIPGVQDALQQWTSASTGAAIKPPASTGNGKSRLCASDFGPCIEGTWSGNAPTYTSAGALTVASLPGAGVSLGLNGSLGVNVSAKEFGLAGQAALNATLPLGSEVVSVGLPSGSVAVGTGAGIAAVLGRGYQYSIGGNPYSLQPAGFYAHAVVNAGFGITIAGLTASIPAGKSGEVFVGFENNGPSIYLSGDCDIPIGGPPKVPGGPATAIANISSCTLGWFGSQPLTHTLSLKLLDPSRPLPAVGSALPTVDTSIDSAILLGGAITFAELPAVTFNGLMTLDPDSTAADSVTFRNLSKARAGLEGDASINVGNFSMSLGNAAMVYDVPTVQLNLGAKIPVLSPFTAIGATFGTKFSGDAYAYGRFGKGSNQLVFDFSKANLFDFDLDKFQGQLDFNKKTLAVAGKLKFARSWVDLTGTFGGGSTFSLTGGTGVAGFASSSLTVGTRGVRFVGSAHASGRTWSFNETLTTPRTIKSSIVNGGATILGVHVNFDVWAQYTMGGDLSVEAKATQSLAGLSTSEVFDVDTGGNITLAGGAKVKIL